MSNGKSSKFVLPGDDTAVSESLELLSFLDGILMAWFADTKVCKMHENINFQLCYQIK